MRHSFRRYRFYEPLFVTRQFFALRLFYLYLLRDSRFSDHSIRLLSVAFRTPHLDLRGA